MTPDRRDIKVIQARATEEAVGGGGTRGWVLFQDCAIRGKDRNPWPGSALIPAARGHNRAIRRPAQTIDAARITKIMEEGICPQRAIILYRIGPQLPD